MGQKGVQKGSKMGTLKPVHVVHFCCKVTGFWGNFAVFGSIFGALFARWMPRARGFRPKGPKKGFENEGSEMDQKWAFQTGPLASNLTLHRAGITGPAPKWPKKGSKVLKKGVKIGQEGVILGVPGPPNTRF